MNPPNILARPSRNALAQEGYRPQQHVRGKTYGTRYGGGPKGSGWLGELMRPDGGMMTEYTIGMPINGVEMEIPSIVPTLTQEEVNLILNMGEGDQMPESVMRKAKDHAIMRINQGYSPFFD